MSWRTKLKNTKKTHNPNHHVTKCFFDFSWHVALVFALRSMLIFFFPHPIPDTKINTSETSCAGSHENSLIKFRQKLMPNFRWWIVFFDPHRVKKQIKSPWHGGPTWKTSKIQNWNHHGTERFFRLQLTLGTCNHHPMVEGSFSPSRPFC